MSKLLENKKIKTRITNFEPPMLELSSRAAAGTRKSFKKIKPPMLKFFSRTTAGMRKKSGRRRRSRHRLTALEANTYYTLTASNNKKT